MAKDNIVVAKEMRDRTRDELMSLMDSKREEYQRLRFRHALGQARETHVLGSLRKDIARLRTLLVEPRAQAGLA